MPFFLAFDIATLAISIVFAASIVLTVLGSGSHKPLNVYFIHYTTLVTLWAIFSLTLRLSLYFKAGNAHLLLDIAALCAIASCPFLLLFTARYFDIKGRWPDAISIISTIGVIAFAPFLLTGRFISEPVLMPNGTICFTIAVWGYLASIIPCIPLYIALALFIIHRRRIQNYLISTGAFFVSAGFILGGLIRINVPVMSISHALGVGMMGWYVLRKQLFNPLQDVASELEIKVAERTRALEKARTETERTVQERTARLMEEIAERARAESLLKERADRLELIAHIGQKTTALLELDELLAQTADLIRDAFEYFSVNIFLIRGDHLVMRATSLRAFRPLTDAFSLKVGAEGITGWVAGTGEPLMVPDVTVEPRYFGHPNAADTRSELAVPLKLRGKIIGVLDAQSVRVGAFTSLDLFTQQTIADQLANAIDGVRLYGEVTRRAETLTLINSVSAALSAVLDTAGLLETVYREISPIFAADSFFIALCEEGRNALDFRFQMNRGRRELAGSKPAGAALAQRIIRDRQALLINEPGDAPFSWLGVPMLLGERTIGVICVQTFGRRRYDEEDRTLLTTVADQVAIAVENARLYDALNLELAEHKRTEKTLRESEEQFRNLAEQTPNMIFILRGGRIVYANPQCELATGYARDEIYASDFDFMDVIAPEFRSLISRNIARHMSGEEIAPYEFAILDRNGRRIDAINNTKLIRHAGERAILCVITDITSRKHSERLVKSLNSAALAMEQALSPEEIFPAVAGELQALGFSCSIILAEDSETRIRLLEAGETEGLPLRGAHPSIVDALTGRRTMIADLDPASIADGRALGAGSRGWTAATPESGRTILSAMAVAENVIGLIAVGGKSLGEEDIPVIAAFAHQTAAAWRKTTLMRDLEKSLKDLRTAQDLLLQAQKMEAIGRLAGGIAHDFNNALTVISGFTSLLGESLEGNDSALSDLAEIKNAIKRASALTSRLLAFSRKQIIQPEVLDLNAVLSGCVKLLRPLIGEDIRMTIRTSGQPVPIKADRYQMEQVIVNLAVNARDAMPSGGNLDIGTENRELSPEQAAVLSVSPGPYSVLIVMDNGVGMTEEIRSRIFEPFFTTKENGKGTGLGLPTVYGIVNQAGGAITVESTPNRGSAFTVLIPRCLEENAPEKAPAAEEAPPSGSGTVLLVEDDESVRELAGRILSNAGYTVLAAGSGEKALETAAAQNLDIVITDVVMPGMNGVELAHKITDMKPEMPVLFMSGYTDDPGIRLGVPDGLPFISKPFQPEELLRKVAELISGQKAY